MNPHGHGLGLSVCKRICEKLGGDIKPSSKLGYGSKFTFGLKTYYYQDNNQASQGDMGEKREIDYAKYR